uniref:Uncharacterized protein n=1 Tax=Avena sativa TaxID=4498 RepID=A0ACD5TFZ6_AVESA
MSLLLRRLAGDVSAPLRRSLATAASRPPWAMVYKRPAPDASIARASLDLNEAPCVSQLSLPAHLADPAAAGSVRAASCDGLLLLDFADTREFPPAVRKLCHSSLLHMMAAAGAAAEPGVARFVCNPLSGQMFRLPVPDMDAAKGSTPFGLLTQSSSEGPHGPPDRFVVAQLSCREGDNRRVVRRFLSDAGEWDEPQLFVPSTRPAWRAMQIDTNHEVLAFGDRLWWVDVSWGACSVDPFSDTPEHHFVELPRGSVLPEMADVAGPPVLGRHRRMGFSQGKLRFVEVSTKKEPFLISSFSLDDEACSWTLQHEMTINISLPEESEPVEDHMPWIAAIDPFSANVLYIKYGRIVLAVDMAKVKVIGSCSFPDSITHLSMHNSSLLVPCVLPTWLQSNNIPGAGALSSKTNNCTRKTLADMLVRVDKDRKN